MNIKYKLRLTLLLLLISSVLHTLWAGDKLTTSFEYLKTDFTPRSAAMSGAFTTIRGDVGTMLINPAGMSYVSQSHLSTSYTNFLVDINGGMTAYATQVEGKGTLSAAVVYMDYGSFDYTDVFGKKTGGSFSARDLLLAVGWANKFNYNISYGVNAKMLYSQIENYNAIAVAFDLGVMWEIPYDKDFYFGFALQNVGTELAKYDKRSAELPLSMRVGVSKKLAHLPLEISLSIVDLNYAANSFTERLERFNIGGEFTVNKYLRLRIGYDNRLHNDLKLLKESEFGGISGGAGIVYNAYRVDIGYSNYNLIGNVYRIGLNANL